MLQYVHMYLMAHVPQSVTPEKVLIGSDSLSTAFLLSCSSRSPLILDLGRMLHPGSKHGETSILLRNGIRLVCQLEFALSEEEQMCDRRVVLS